MLRLRSSLILNADMTPDRVGSSRTICAVSVAILDAPVMEIPIWACFSASESLMPSPTKQTTFPSD